MTLSVAPSLGQLVELRAQLFADGSVRLHQSLDGAAETSTAQSAALALAAAWGAARIYLNSEGASVPGIASFDDVKVALGTTYSMDDMRAAA